MSEAKVILSAVDQTKAAFESAKRNMTSLADQILSTKSLMGGFLVLAGGAGAVSIKTFIDSTVASVAALKEFGEKAGTTASQMSTLMGAAKLSGTDMDTVTDGLIKLSKGLAGSEDMTGNAGRALKALGIDAKDSAGNLRDPVDVMKDMAQKLGGFKDGAGKTALAIDAFGKSGAQLLPMLKEMYELGDQSVRVTDQQAWAADEYEKTLKKLAATKNDVLKAATLAMLPVMTDFAQTLLDAANDGNGMRKSLKGLAEDGSIKAWAQDASLEIASVIDMFDGVSRTVEIVGKFLGNTAALIALNAKGEFAAASAAGKAFESDVDRILNKPMFSAKLAAKFAKSNEGWSGAVDQYGQPLGKGALQYNNKDEKPAKKPDHFADNFINQLISEYAALSGSMSKTEEVTRKLDTATEKFSVTERARALTMAGLIDKQKSMADAADNMARITSAELEARQRLDDAHYAALETLEKLATDQNFEITLLGKLPEAIEKARFERDLDNQVRTANAALVARGLQYGWDEIRMEEERGKILRESTDARAAFGKIQADKLDQQYNPDRGVADGIKSYMEEIAKSGDTMKNAVTSAFKGMEDALVSFVKTGKLDFSSLADSIISDMIRMQIQKSVMPAMSSMMAGGGSFIASLFGFADGGRPPVGVPSIVGERGPELFIPDAGGTIIPNHQLGGGGNSLVVNVIESPGNGGEQNRRTENGVDILDIMVEKIKGSIAGDISRGSGAVPAAMNRTYGLNRTVGAY